MAGESLLCKLHQLPLGPLGDSNDLTHANKTVAEDSKG